MTLHLGKPHLGKVWQVAVCFLAVVAAAATLYAHGPLHRQIEEITRQIRVEPDNPGLYLQRGELYRLGGSWSAALADYDRAGRLDPELHEVHLSRALLFHERSHPDAALEAVDRFMEHEPAHGEAVFLRARVLAQLGRRGEAVRDMDHAIKIMRPRKPAQFLERARLVATWENVDLDGTYAIERAIRGLDDGMKQLGVVVSLQLYAIELEEARGAYDQALERLDMLEDQHTRKEALLARRGRILEAAGRWLEAQVAYTEALDAIALLQPRLRNTGAIEELESFVRSKLAITSVDKP
jgi:tetratricopeptide (TPR) repeat protein